MRYSQYICTQYKLQWGAMILIFNDGSDLLKKSRFDINREERILYIYKYIYMHLCYMNMRQIHTKK